MTFMYREILVNLDLCEDLGTGARLPVIDHQKLQGARVQHFPSERLCM